MQSQSDNLIDLALVLGQPNDYRQVLHLVAQRAARLLNADIALIMMINPRTRETVKTMFTEGHEYEHRKFRSVHRHVTGWIVKNKQSFVSQNILKDSRFRKNIFNSAPIKTVLGVPLGIEGVIIGTIILLKETLQMKDLQEDLVFLEKLAAISAPHLRSVQKIRKYFESLPPDEALLCQYEKVGLLGKSKKFVELLQAIETAARSDVRVLLEGQSGTGKELIARAIHKFSPRREYPFIAVDCGAIPAHLLESELFGHVKGSFTGANSDRQGLLVEADRGTLFMDEIANLPMEMQTKLMRVLQENEIRPLGSNRLQKLDVRIISASSSSLKELAAKEKFRQDLYFRLHVYPIYVPGLNERREDIPLLAEHFLSKFAAQQTKQLQRFHEEIVDFMKVRNWEGHIRELENFVERLVTLASPQVTVIGKEILPDDLKKEIKTASSFIDAAYIMKSLPESLDEFEERLIRRALLDYDWNKSKAARSLKIPVQTILYKMERLGIKKSN